MGKSGGGNKGNVSLSWQALKTNLCCGDFIEAAYPYMEKSRVIRISAYFAAGISSEIILQRRVYGMAYFPLPLAIWISNDCIGMTAACLAAYIISLTGTIIANYALQ